MKSGDLDSLFDQVSAFERPPVETWHPERTVDFDLRIDRKGDWYHEGGIIPRRKLVKLFSTVLAFRDGDYFLVTPPARYRIQVDDLPFMAVEMTTRGKGEGQTIFLRTNMDEVVTVDADHPLWVETDPDSGQLAPSVMVRDGLAARLTRPVYYSLADLCTVFERDKSGLGVHSAGAFFPLE